MQSQQILGESGRAVVIQAAAQFQHRHLRQLQTQQRRHRHSLTLRAIIWLAQPCHQPHQPLARHQPYHSHSLIQPNSRRSSGIGNMQTRAGHSTSIPGSVHPNAGSVATLITPGQTSPTANDSNHNSSTIGGWVHSDGSTSNVYFFEKRRTYQVRINSHASPTEKRGKKAKREFQSFQISS